MLGRTYEYEACSAARALEIAGERWSLLILRNALFAGITRFTDFQHSLKIAPNILIKRLESFVEEGLMVTSKGETEHLEYILTPKGLDFKPVIIALTVWGDKWAAPEGPPIRYQHEGCGGEIEQQLCCKICQKPIEVENITAQKTEAMAIYQDKIMKQKKIPKK
jgi:DNA-binding HxlR family transcriptional regulator